MSQNLTSEFLKNVAYGKSRSIRRGLSFAARVGVADDRQQTVESLALRRPGQHASGPAGGAVPRLRLSLGQPGTLSLAAPTARPSERSVDAMRCDHREKLESRATKRKTLQNRQKANADAFVLVHFIASRKSF